MNEDQLDADFMAWARQEGLLARVSTAAGLRDLRSAYMAGYANGRADAEDAAGLPLN